MKFCIDCKHYWPETYVPIVNIKVNAVCWGGPKRFDPVTGKQLPSDPAVNRFAPPQSRGYCGSDAEWFEAKGDESPVSRAENS